MQSVLSSPSFLAAFLDASIKGTVATYTYLYTHARIYVDNYDILFFCFSLSLFKKEKKIGRWEVISPY